MAAYFLIDVDVNDPEGYEDYKKLSGPSVALYGGKFLVRGGACQIIEGDWPTHRFVILEFEDEAHFKRWFYSPEYEKAKAIRHSTSTANAILVKGA